MNTLVGFTRVAPDAKGAPKRHIGFALLSPEQRKEIARKGGRMAHAMGAAHEYDHDEAIAAGRKGGLSVSKIPGHMAKIGRLGGEKRKILAQELAAAKRQKLADDS